jgi:hypothetical protein
MHALVHDAIEIAFARRSSVTASLVKELYNSPNGDRWALCRGQSGRLVVSHQPNRASGGRASEIDVELFLSQPGHGPEHQALIEALTKLDDSAQNNAGGDEPAVEAADKMSRVLGQAVARCWSKLPQDIQQNLFEAAVTSEGEAIRQQLAVYLHGKHERTVEAVQARAMPEPDSLGG